MTTKKCSKCERELSIDNFPMQARKVDGVKKQSRRTECKDCYNEYFRNYMKNNKNHQNRVRQGKRKRQQEVTDLKLAVGCQVCGYKGCYSSLHFHHKDPEIKEYSISWGVQRQLSGDNIQKELDKCIIVCSNCHGEIEQGITECPEIEIPIKLADLKIPSTP